MRLLSIICLLASGVLCVLWGCNSGNASNLDWTGSYSREIGWYDTRELVLNRDGTFRYSVTTDVRISGYDDYYTGTYEETDTTLTLDFEQHIEKASEAYSEFTGVRKTTTEKQGPNGDSVLYKVQWDGRRYLVWRSHMLGFVSEVNGLILPDGGSHSFLHGKDREVEISGYPSVPSKYTHLMDTTRIEGQIVDVLSDSTVQIRFEPGADPKVGLMYWGQWLGYRLIDVEGRTGVALGFPTPFQPRGPSIGPREDSENPLRSQFEAGTRISSRAERWGQLGEP